MPIPTDLFVLEPGTLPGGVNYCFQNWQRLNVDILSAASVRLRIDVGTTYWNVSATTPPADKRIYPWLNLNDGRVYQWSFTYGKWISPRSFSFGCLWTPTAGTPESDLWSLDGGDGTNPAISIPTPVTGAMWQVLHQFDGRVPIGAGSVPNSTPALSLSSGDTGGEAQHILTEQEGGVGQHYHRFGLTVPGNDDAFFRQVSPAATVPGYSGYFITGSGSNRVNPETTADLATLPPGSDGAGVTSVGHNNLQPYCACYVVYPTARQFYTVP